MFRLLKCMYLKKKKFIHIYFLWWIYILTLKDWVWNEGKNLEPSEEKKGFVKSLNVTFI